MWGFMLSLFMSAAQAGVPGKVDLTKLDGSKMEASVLEDKAILFVNVASKCGYTSQYEGLQALYEKYKDRGFVVVGVPCNQFGGQEPGSSEEIQTFCKANYGVTFPLLEKQDVNGKRRSDLYKELVSSEKGGGKSIRWNFEKFLVDQNGNVVGRYGSGTKPNSKELQADIETILAK